MTTPFVTARDTLTVLSESVIAKAETQIRKLYLERDKAANAIAERELGIELPLVHTFRDQNGNLYSVNVYASVKLVERAQEGSDDHN